MRKGIDKNKMLPASHKSLQGTFCLYGLFFMPAPAGFEPTTFGL